jgi:hypothetical protein
MGEVARSSRRTRVANVLGQLPAFAVAGVALVGAVLDQSDACHDNAQGIVVVAAGAATGCLAGLVVAWGTTEPRAARARHAAWVVVRMVLAFEMVRYGMAKVLNMQFYPQYWKLDLRPVDMQPNWLAWTFFGRSYGYQAIGGVLEIASGILLCFRRTTLLGACLLATVLLDVVLVDFFYDAPVKLFSSVYLTMTLSLIAREAPRVRACFFPARVDQPSSPRALALRGAGAALVLGLPAAASLRDAAGHGVFRTDALEGAWSVDQVSGLDGLLPETPGTWQRIYFEKGDYGFVRAGQELVRFQTHVDEAAHTLTLSALGGRPSSTLAGAFEQREHRLHFAGSRNGTPFSLDLTLDFSRQTAHDPASR